MELNRALSKSDRCGGTWGGVLGVLAVLFVVAWGGYAVADELEAPPLEVTPGVGLQPVDGWELGGRTEDLSGVILTNGGGSLWVGTADTVEPGEQVLAAFITEYLSVGADSFAASSPSILPPWGQSTSAVRAAYTGRWESYAFPIEGEVTIVTFEGITLIFDGWASHGEYHVVRDDIESMIRSATVS